MTQIVGERAAARILNDIMSDALVEDSRATSRARLHPTKPMPRTPSSTSSERRVTESAEEPSGARSDHSRPVREIRII